MSNTQAIETFSDTNNLSVFDWVDARHQFLVGTYDRLMVTPDRKQISRCLYLAHQIQNACKHHESGILAALQLNRTPKHQYIKELMAGVLCELLGKKARMTPSSRLLLICASLTQDIAMLDLQDSKLDRQATPLTESQLKFIRKHATTGRSILVKAGVKDALWLNAVEQHHERLDGSGYPNGLKEEDISLGAKVLAIADIYAAMVRPRGDRGIKTPKYAIKEVFLQRGEQLDVTLVKNLIDILGVYPPGAWVKLANGELGVVSASGQDVPFPIVSVVLDNSGQLLPSAQTRDTQIKECSVIDMVDTPFLFNLGAILSSIWPTIPEDKKHGVKGN
ncbi:HD-GYP domain-containing protein [Motiliproteus sp. MSK22-1]|uniref:HD-GYP domain-containing protein n=1 Tax=Motiliproteus sp. MSK22-1 TaxID=1897630 RepID=UPI0009761D8C|nr:HD domain-containing phosphohydrolase [Motiliproteus sp. MSK22-1]OMH39725.1 hypothetical protein BGP75_01295 [Motiliproteus sp. MSK22-1]